MHTCKTYNIGAMAIMVITKASCIHFAILPISSDKEMFSYVKYSHRKQKKEKQNGKAVFTVVENVLKMYCIKGIFQKWCNI